MAGQAVRSALGAARFALLAGLRILAFELAYSQVLLPYACQPADPPSGRLRQLLQVPLLIKYPNQQEGRVVHAAVSTLDLVPTILRVLGRGCDGCDGRPLQDAERATDRPLLAYHMHDDEVRPIRRNVQAERWKLVRNTEDGEQRDELFDVHGDPGNFRDVASGTWSSGLPSPDYS